MRIISILRRLRASAVVAGIVCTLGFLPKAHAAASFVQAVGNAVESNTKTFSLAFPANTSTGDLILVGFDF